MTPRGDPDGELRLWLLRHAKAASDAPRGGTDHDRPLAARGKRDAAALGLRLGAGDLGFGAGDEPGLLLASTAARTTETAERVAAPLRAEIDRRERLYYGSPTDVLAELQTLDDGVRSVMVVGHNPATHSLAVDLLAQDDAGRASLSAFPTCAVALFRTGATRWRDVACGAATLAGFARPPYDA